MARKIALQIIKQKVKDRKVMAVVTVVARVILQAWDMQKEWQICAKEEAQGEQMIDKIIC